MALSPFPTLGGTASPDFIIVFSLLRHKSPSVAPLGGFALVAPLRPRASSYVPAPRGHYVCRPTASGKE